MERATRTLDRLLSRRGVASRALARDLVRAGRVTVDGRVATDAGEWVSVTADVRVDGRPATAAGRVVLAMNKPRGYVSTRTDEQGRATAFELLPAEAPWVVPVGRLDRASAGLLLWTNDTDLADALTDPRRHVPRVYEVKVARRLDDAAITALAAGVDIGDPTPTLPCPVERLRDGPRSTWLRITLGEGRNRQIRRMIATVGGATDLVEHLIRVRFGPVALGDLAPGAVRALREDEVRALADAGRHARGETSWGA